METIYLIMLLAFAALCFAGVYFGALYGSAPETKKSRGLSRIDKEMNELGF